MGGALTVLAAVNVPEADACVAWYGYPPLEYVDASKIKAPLMGHFAIDDVPFPIAKRTQQYFAGCGLGAGRPAAARS